MRNGKVTLRGGCWIVPNQSQFLLIGQCVECVYCLGLRVKNKHYFVCVCFFFFCEKIIVWGLQKKRCFLQEGHMGESVAILLFPLPCFLIWMSPIKCIFSFAHHATLCVPIPWLALLRIKIMLIKIFYIFLFRKFNCTNHQLNFKQGCDYFFFFY